MSYIHDITVCTFTTEDTALHNLRKLIALYERTKHNHTILSHFRRMAKMIAVIYSELSIWRKHVDSNEMASYDYSEWNDISTSICTIIRTNLSDEILVRAMIQILRVLFRIDSVKMHFADSIIFQEVFHHYYLNEKVCNSILATLFNHVSDAHAKQLSCGMIDIIISMIRIHSNSARVCGKAIALLARMLAGGIRPQDRNNIAKGELLLKELERRGVPCNNIESVQTLFMSRLITITEMSTLMKMFYTNAYYEKNSTKERLQKIYDSGVIDIVIIIAQRFRHDPAVQAECAVFFRNMAMKDVADVEMVEKGVLQILFDMLTNNSTLLYVLEQALPGIMNLVCTQKGRTVFHEMRIFLPYITMLMTRWRHNYEIYFMLNRIVRNLTSTVKEGGPLPFFEDIMHLVHPIVDYDAKIERIDTTKILDCAYYELDCFEFPWAVSTSVPHKQCIIVVETKTLLQTLFDIAREIFVDNGGERKMQNPLQTLCDTLETLGHIATCASTHDVMVKMGVFLIIKTAWDNFHSTSLNNSIIFLLRNMANNFTFQTTHMNVDGDMVVTMRQPNDIHDAVNVQVSLPQVFFHGPSANMAPLKALPKEGCACAIIRITDEYVQSQHDQIWEMLRYYGVTQQSN